MQYFPINIKLTYSEKLDIQLFIRHQLQSQKFKRHYIFCQGYSHQEENKILKSYLSFVKQGDLYKIKTSNYSGKWKEKTFEDIATLLEKEHSHPAKEIQINLQNQVANIQQACIQNQYDQIIVVTIFIADNVREQRIKEFCEFVTQIQRSEFILNLFIPDTVVQKIIPLKTWFRVYTTKDIKLEIRGLFSTLSRTPYKRITFGLKCLDGDISINESSHHYAKNAWKMEKNQGFEYGYIENTVYFPSSNSPYIMSAELKNMMGEEACRFEMAVTYEDETGHVGQMSKSFSLKITKEFLDWTESNESEYDSQSLCKYQQLSLNFEEVNLNQKLNFIKVIGTPVRVVIKKGSEV